MMLGQRWGPKFFRAAGTLEGSTDHALMAQSDGF